MCCVCCASISFVPKDTRHGLGSWERYTFEYNSIMFYILRKLKIHIFNIWWLERVEARPVTTAEKRIVYFTAWAANKACSARENGMMTRKMVFTPRAMRPIQLANGNLVRKCLLNADALLWQRARFLVHTLIHNHVLHKFNDIYSRLHYGIRDPF